jgi:hypothetical protein
MPARLRKRSRSRTAIDEAAIARRKKLQAQAAAQTAGPTRCGPGKILRAAYPREGYTRKSYVTRTGKKVSSAKVHKTLIPTTCVAARGKAKSTGKKGTQIFRLRKGDLTKFGYHGHLSAEARHKALEKALAAYGTLSLARKLGAIVLEHKNTNPSLSATFQKDRAWVEGHK